jgi:2-polyprenyl-3-methyl-5-hydroxy-6-metoxy-1,4-benzoquinol methylase
MKIVECLNCGLIYVNPQPSEGDLKKIYGNGYFDGSDHADYLTEKELYVPRFQERLRQINSFIKKGKLLDIGCAVGYFLEAAREEGWRSFGVEISSFASKHSRDSGFDVFTGTLEEARYPDQHFDVVTLWHVLEHMEDPSGCLKEIHRILRKSGLIAIEVPNIGSKRFKKLRENWDQLKPHEHLYYFTLGVLRKMAERAGFETVEVSTIPKGTNVGEKLENFRLARIKKRLIKLFRYTQWIKKSILYFKRITGEDDIILLYASKS